MKRFLILAVLAAALAGCVYAPGPGYGYHHGYYYYY